MSTTDHLNHHLPSPPFHHIPGLENFRDIGGYPSTLESLDFAATNNTNDRTAGEASPTTKNVIRKGIVFRSADPSQVTSDGISALNALGIQKVYDLRSKPEVSRPGKVREWEGAERVFVPVFPDQDFSPEAITRWSNYAAEGPDGFKTAYLAILQQLLTPTSPLAKILIHLSTTPSTSPTLLHCTAGKDRTGVITAILLSLCGVPFSHIAHDYSLTSIAFSPASREAKIRSIMSVKGSPLAGDREGAERMCTARGEVIIAILEVIKEEYGGVEEMVLRRCGVDIEVLGRVRRNLVVRVEG